MDAFELLKKDHKKVSQLFEEIESASGSSKQQLFRQLKSELDLHAHVEEKILYPALENKEESRDITLEAYEEHKVVKELLAELASESPSDEWDAKLKVLRENVEHHVEEEEGELFDKAEDVLSEEQIERLGAEMEAEKARQGGAPAARPDSPKPPSAPAKSRTAAKKSESPGVLKRLANLVGLGDSSAARARKSAGPSNKAASSKKSAATKKAAASKKSAGTKKSAASKKSSGTKKSVSSVKKSGKQATKKTAAKTTSKKSGAKKAAKRPTSGARKSTKKSGTKSSGRTKSRGSGRRGG